MTGRKPEFENYSPPPRAGVAERDPDSGALTSDWAEPSTSQPYQVRPYRVPSPNAGPTRRGFLGLAIGVPAAALVLGAIGAASSTGEGDGSTAHEGVEDSDEILDVGEFSAVVPAGWSLRRIDQHEVSVTKRGNRVRAYAFAAGSTAAADLVKSLIRRRRDGFSGALGEPFSEPAANAQHVTVTANGKLAGKAARLKGELYIDADDQALLVIQVLTAKPRSEVAAEAEQMAAELAADF